LLRKLILAAAACIGWMSSSAHAQQDSVQVDVTAQIPVRCGFADDLPQSFAAPRDLEEAGNLVIRVRLDCNAPYAFGVTAEHGALVNTDTASTVGDYAVRKAYGVRVTLDTDQGVVRSGRCRSTELTTGGDCPFAGAIAGQGLGSGPGISIGRDATVTVDWPNQSTQTNRLAPGRYQDTLVLVVGARA
jgi:hypothetical protein